MTPMGAITTFKEAKELVKEKTTFYLLVPSNAIMKLRTTEDSKFMNKPELFERSPKIVQCQMNTKHCGYESFSLSFININMGKSQNEKKIWLFRNYWYAMAYAERRKQRIK